MRSQVAQAVAPKCAMHRRAVPKATQMIGPCMFEPAMEAATDWLTAYMSSPRCLPGYPGSSVQLAYLPAVLCN